LLVPIADTARTAATHPRGARTYLSLSSYHSTSLSFTVLTTKGSEDKDNLTARSADIYLFFSLIESTHAERLAKSADIYLFFSLIESTHAERLAKSADIYLFFSLTESTHAERLTKSADLSLSFSLRGDTHVEKLNATLSGKDTTKLLEGLSNDLLLRSEDDPSVKEEEQHSSKHHAMLHGKTISQQAT
jgi:hypothetical protein